MGTQKSQKGRLSAAQAIQEIGHRKSGPATTAKRSRKMREKPGSGKPKLGKHQLHRPPRPSLVGSRFGDRTDDIVPTPGSPSLGEIQRSRRRHAA